MTYNVNWFNDYSWTQWMRNYPRGINNDAISLGHISHFCFRWMYQHMKLSYIESISSSRSVLGKGTDQKSLVWFGILKLGGPQTNPWTKPWTTETELIWTTFGWHQVPHPEMKQAHRLPMHVYFWVEFGVASNMPVLQGSDATMLGICFHHFKVRQAR